MDSDTEAAEQRETESLRPELQQIIARGRRRGGLRHGSARAAAALSVLSFILLWLSFTPLELAPLAWLALIPLIQLVRLASLPAWSYLHLWLLGILWGLLTLQWMRLGHPAMYGALVALAAYLALYFPAFVALSRRVVAGGIPVWVAVPLVWTSLEYARAYLLTGFSWYYLGHTQYRWLSLIQISDVTGAYGVTFVVALGNAGIALQVPQQLLFRMGLNVRPEKGGRLLPAAAAAAAVIACCAYGALRFQDPSSFDPGPVVALIQGDFTPEVKHDPDSWNRRYAIHDRLTRHCTELRPEFIVWPETMFPWPEQSVDDGVTDEQLIAGLPLEMLQHSGIDSQLVAESWRSDVVRKLLADNSRMVGAALVMGIEAHVAGSNDVRAYNSAAFIRPDLGYMNRYDKMHRVIFGEYIPLKNLFPWLSNLTPFGPNYGIAAGSAAAMFEYADWRLAPLICFEDTVPHLVRRIAGQRTEDGRPCDVLVNLTNDAWFHGSSELDQHLITSAFRCVETRTPLVRAVNGGISAFIDGNGQVREPDRILVIDDDTQQQFRAQLTEVTGMRDPQNGRWRRRFSGIILGQVPLDARSSVYLQVGDLFAAACLLITGLAAGRAAVAGRK